ncbi:unnamed protein product, partial [Darwinula stevensoni]
MTTVPMSASCFGWCCSKKSSSVSLDVSHDTLQGGFNFFSNNADKERLGLEGLLVAGKAEEKNKRKDHDESKDEEKEETSWERMSLSGAALPLDDMKAPFQLIDESIRHFPKSSARLDPVGVQPGLENGVGGKEVLTVVRTRPAWNPRAILPLWQTRRRILKQKLNSRKGSGSPHRSLTKSQLHQVDLTWNELQKSNTTSILKEVLTEELFQHLRTRCTQNGNGLHDIIKSGVLYADSKIGVYAPDTWSYEVFWPLFKEVCQRYHGVTCQFQSGFWDSQIPSLPLQMDSTGRAIISTRIRVTRNLKDFELLPNLSEKGLLEIEKIVVQALTKFTGKIKGHYHPIASICKIAKEFSHFVFQKDDKFLEVKIPLLFLA